jgi:hypothetical protein
MILLTLGVIGGITLPAHAGITVYEEGDKKIEIGGRIQPLYINVMPDCSSGVPCLEDDSGRVFNSSTDRFFFRRLRPYIAGTITKYWMGKIEFDFGVAEDADEVLVKDAFFARSGYANKHSKLTIGNAKTVFSREFLTSSSSLIVVERGFTGDHNFGVPDRALGVRWDSRLRDGKVSYAANLGAEHHDPAINRMDFDTPVNNAADWNEGLVAAARVDFYPLGYFKFSQADFDRGPSRVAFGLSAFTWRNDGDNNTYTDANGNTIAPNPTKVDLDSADGFEASFAYRGRGVSLDAEYHVVSGETVDKAFTGGLYRDGKTDLEAVSIVGGYLFPKNLFEVVLAWQSQDADNYEDEFTRTSLGFNWYLNKHNLKFQVSYMKTENFIGVRGQDQDVIFASTQFKF